MLVLCVHLVTVTLVPFQRYGYGGWVHMDHSVSCGGSGPREANMMKDGKFFRKVKVTKLA